MEEENTRTRVSLSARQPSWVSHRCARCARCARLFSGTEPGGFFLGFFEERKKSQLAGRGPQCQGRTRHSWHRETSYNCVARGSSQACAFSSQEGARGGEPSGCDSNGHDKVTTCTHSPSPLSAHTHTRARTAAVTNLQEAARRAGASRRRDATASVRI